MPSIPQHTARGITAVNDGFGRQILRDDQFLIVTSPSQSGLLRLPSSNNSWEGQTIEGFVGANGFTLTGATSINGSSTYQIPPNYFFSAMKGVGSLWVVDIINNEGVGVTKLQVATNFNVPDFIISGTTSTANNQQVIRLLRYAGGDIMADLQLSLSAFYVQTSGEVNAPAYVARASFEVGGVLVPCTWNGSQTVTINSGDADIKCDPIQPSAFGLSFIPDQAEIFIKMERTYAAGVSPSYWFSGAITTQDKNVMVRGAAGLPTQVNTPGPLQVSTGGWSATVTSYFAPTAILGKMRKGFVGTVIVGASLENGANDSPGDGTGGTGGYIRRGFSVAKYRSYICLAVGGQTAADYLATRAKRGLYEKYADAAASGFGGNDYSSNTISSASAITSIRAVNALLKSVCKKVAQIRMSPKSDSTDQWASVDGANQTVRAGNGGFLPYRAAIDAAAAADVLSGVIDRTIDCTSAIEVPTNTGLWKGTGVALAVTTDGTHPSNLRHGEMATNIAPQIDALIAMAASS